MGFFFNETATTEIYTLSLHDALPISTGIEPEPHQQMLKPVKILEAMERSLKSGQIEKVVK